ncbi:TPA: hypothetical protein N0F65_007695 [Lagenidium giganteum]|uniref:Uncharacterized protein n=1 Tax=Lagenidium giganteum TaxID=4803 RepID=A0AAV2YZW2_9STRA|nr:TPA: hypothetical protein N0F65_007695 [Lagenidium giganteum]
MPDGHASPAGNPLKRSTPSSPRNSARNLHSATPRGSSNRNLLNRGNLTAQASFRNAVRNVRGSAKFSPHLHTVHKFELEPTPFDADDHVMACIDYIHDETFLQVRELERTTKIWSYTAQTTATALMEALKAATQTTTPTAPSKTDMVEPTSVGDPLLEAVMNQVPEAPQPAAIDAQCPFEISTRAPIESFGIAHTNVRKRSHSNRRLGLVRTNSYRSKLDLLSRLSSSSSSIRKKNQNAAKDDTPRQPIVFSIDPDPSTKPRLSPRKSIALLRSALRMSQGFIFPGAAPSAAQAAAPTHPSQPAPSPRQKSSPRRVAKVVKAKAAPCMWEPCYPDKPLVDENPPVSVEYNVRRNQTSGLPDLRPGRSASIAVPRPLVLSDEVTVAPDQSYLGEFTKSDRYEEDLTSVGHQIDGIVLSPGVKLQAGEVTKSGPNLPDLPAHMRKAVYEVRNTGWLCLAVLASCLRLCT